MEQFIKNILNGKKSKIDIVDQLYTRPTKDENGDNPTFPKIAPNYSQQIDLLYLPNDNGKKYCLVVVDQGSRYLGAVALEDRTVHDVIKALKELYKNSKYLKKPVNIISDRGSEFLGSFDFELHKMGIEHHKLVKVGRHRSVSLAERKNQTIGKIISKILTQVQLTTGNASSKWVSYLQIIVESINNKIDEQNKKVKPEKLEDVKPITSNPNHKIDLLNEGDEVRVSLDNPIDVNGKSLNGKFRTGDIRWNPKIRTVKYMYMKPNEPIMYFLDGDHGDLKIETVGYTRNQLQKVSTREKDIEIQTPLFENENNRHEIQKITDRGVNELEQIMYLVKFKGIRKAIWMERSKLVQDLGKSYMDKLDKKFKEVDQ